MYSLTTGRRKAFRAITLFGSIPNTSGFSVWNTGVGVCLRFSATRFMHKLVAELCASGCEKNTVLSSALACQKSYSGELFRVIVGLYSGYGFDE